ncbi:hypothetical protein FSARC_675 [Fusarium sarcochroum]|uniref:Zn(2)-C6 fungal-type domain-containing protein n=1 Tax=Fusarium sarcochroum TaxID=1208366 RepID=A0A8H4UB55_9HYPO|nr:hypothetical protein FSARC_675 [Fusarium sarcochroum]
MDNVLEKKMSAPEQDEPETRGEIIDMDDTYTPGEERAVLRKIDMVILPFMCFVFFLQYLDKQSLSYAAIFGLIEDLNLTSSQYSWCSSIFYVGQLVAEYPCIYLMSRLHLTKFVGATIIVWGIVCMCLAAPQNFAGFATVRFLLGFSEGAVSPAFVTITSIWYRKSEHTLRTALWVTMNGIAQVVGCLLMYGIGKNTALSLDPWRTLFLVCGAMTVVAGIAFFTLMPNGPRDAWFLSPREREVLSMRMAHDREGGDKTSFSLGQLRETMLDPKAWMVFWFGVLLTMQSPVLTFASLVIKSIGYTQLETMLYTAPSGAVQIGLLWVGVGLCALFPQQRTLVVLFLIIPPLIGNVFLMKLDVSAGWGLIAASWVASCMTATMSIVLSLSASNVKGNTKRALVNCMFFIGYCAGCIGSPQLWTHGPRYREGVITSIVTWCLLFVAIIGYRVLCIRDNKKRDKAGETRQNQEVILDKNGLPKSDLTDKEDGEFRHVKCDNVRPCTRCARNGVECLNEWIRFKNQPPPPVRLARTEDATSKEYTFSADQTWCSPEGELSFVEEREHLATIYHIEPIDTAGHERRDSEDATTPRETSDNDTIQMPDQHPDSPTLNTGAHFSETHQSSLETGWSTDLSSHRLLERPHSQQQHGSPSQGSGAHLAENPSPDIQSSDYNLQAEESLGVGEETAAHTLQPVLTGAPVYRNISVWPLKDAVEAKLMRYFIEKIARRFDLCDPKRHFALVVPWRAAFCPPLLDAALALSARCLSRTTDFDTYTSNRYYQRCLNSLISTLEIADALKNQDLFAAVVLLRTLEEIDGPLSGSDTQSHLIGGHLFARESASELTTSMWSPGVLREPDELSSLRNAALMVAFRQEVYMAFACQRPVLPAFYLPQIDRCLDNPTDDGTWTYRILLHLVDALKFCFGDEPTTPENSIGRHDQLLSYAEEWYTKKPHSFNVLFYGEDGQTQSDNENRCIAPEIWILSDAAATGLLNYHLLRILLLSFDPHIPRLGPLRSQSLKKQDREVKEEVKTCIGLAEGNPECAPHFLLASLGIALAGDRFEEQWEQEALMKFLKKAESLHGWSTLTAQWHLPGR